MSLQCIQLKKKTAIAQVTDELQTFPERRSCGGHLGDNTLDFNLYLACLYQPTNLTNCMPGIYHYSNSNDMDSTFVWTSTFVSPLC